MSLLNTMQVRVEGASANGLYSQALVVGNMVFLSGVTGVDPATGNLVEGTVADRTVSYLINCGLLTLTRDRPRLSKISLES
jgi:enamine deaminase RidA (YjgF/YER057c/UK114 family)